MADPPTSPTKAGPTTNPTPQPDNPTSQPGPPPAPPPPPPQLQALNPSLLQNPNPNNVNPNNPNPSVPIPSFPGQGTLVNPPPLRPVPQFSPLPNYQGTTIAGVGIPPPGVSAAAPGSVPSVPPVMQYQVPVPGQPPNPVLRPPFAPLPNGYVPPPQGTVAPPGIARFPSPYQAMVRPLYPIRPPGAPGVLPVISRPPMPGIVGVRPIIPPIIRPTVPSITPAEKPQTTVYIGKISPTVEDDFMLPLLWLCGPVKSWKRAQDPSGTPRGFGFCEFESAEGVLRALRLLSKFNIDGQELVLNVNQATREYLERYVEKKSENSRNLKEAQAAGADKDGENAPNDEKNQPLKSTAENSNNDCENDKKESYDPARFGIVSDEDKEGDREAMEKLTSIIEERIKTKPLPPPPPPALADGSGNQTSELQAKSKDGDTMENDATEGKIDDETSSDNKAVREQDGPDMSSPDRSRRNDRRSRDRERDLKREQERELERYEREAERERVRKEREQRRKIEDAEREFEECLRDWEYREKERERQRHLDKEREKERERKRRKEIQYDEDDDEDDRKRWRRSVIEERRRKRLQEKEEDLADRLKEEEEIAEAKRRAEEEKQWLQQRDTSMLSAAHAINGGEKAVVPEEASGEIKDNAAEQDYEPDSGNENHKGDGILQNGVGGESTIPSVAESDTRQRGTAPAKKLGFGLVGSGKRATVLSVFNEEDEDEAHRDKKMRPLVPIDYSTEELQAIQPTVSGGQPPNLTAAAEYAKRISNVTPKEEKSDTERERSRRTHDRSIQRERDHNYEDVGRSRDENKEKALERDRDRENGVAKVKTPDKQKLLDAKQLIDMIPKTKDELFAYEINWSVYDKHELHERMRPWISKKITEFLGEEETTLVDYIVSSTQEHVQASQMLEMLQSILDDEAEMFVLKMWRMLIFEIKKVETGLALRSKS